VGAPFFYLQKQTSSKKKKKKKKFNKNGKNFEKKPPIQTKIPKKLKLTLKYQKTKNLQ